MSMNMMKIDDSCPVINVTILNTSSVQVDFDTPFTYSGGSLRGHQLPGSFFLIWGFWQLIHIIIHYFLSLEFKGRLYTSISWYGCYRGFPIEPFFKLLFPTCGCILEVWGIHSYRPLLSRDGLFTNSNIYQHVCMYSMFMMSGTVDFLGHLTAPVPEGSEKLMLALAFGLKGTLVLFHLGTPELSTMAHLFMVFIAYCAGLCCIGEIWFPHNILLSLLRGTAILFQGVWWHTVGNILYGGYRYWHPCYHNSVMMVSMVFGFTTLAMIACNIFLYAIIYCIFSRKLGTNVVEKLGLTSIAEHYTMNLKTDFSNYIPVEISEAYEEEEFGR